ncbi:hypothetical protein LTR85_009604 [Meristemomyces frigidus]|nr:hypothetical protein LTR85_009604 [Meristemomyces frigidus]
MEKAGAMPAHIGGCRHEDAPWGEFYCRCFIEMYLADKVAAPATDAHSLSTDVFLIPELREHILSFLPMQDLARAERVSKAWQYSLGTSPILQRQLFAAADGSTVMPVRHDGLAPIYDVQLTLNPRLTFDVVYEDRGASLREPHPVALRASIARINFAPTNRAMQPLRLLGDPEKETKGQGPTQCLTQPPCFGVLVTCDRTTRHTAYISNKSGVTLDDVMDTLRRMWRSSATSEERVGVADFFDATYASLGVIFPEQERAAESESDEDEEETETAEKDPVGFTMSTGTINITRAEIRDLEDYDSDEEMYEF